MLIALLTDFGTRDPYVAAMKGVIAARTAAPIVDLTHEIEPFDVFGAAWFLEGVLPYYPRGAAGERPACVIVAVVDPGVGSSRRILAAELDGRILLAPDNGLLSLQASAAARIRSVENSELFLPERCSTFHGRDRFAPVAALLAEGLELDAVGPPVGVATMVRLDYDPPEYGTVIRGRVVAIDRFGNAVTDIDAARAGVLRGKTLSVAAHRISNAAANFADAGDDPFMVVGSRGTVEISLRNRSAADILQIARFDRVEIRTSDE